MFVSADVRSVGEPAAMDPILIARYGMTAASQRFEDAASRIAGSAAEGGGDLVTAMTDLVQAKQTFAANAKVIRFADEMWDSLLSLQSR